MFKRSFIGLALALPALAACALPPPPEVVATEPPRLTADAYITADGARLPLHEWLPKGAPRAVILGLHGFGDYGQAFALAAGYWQGEGIATYAYDQRGFGGAPDPGRFAGEAAMVGDARAAAALLAARYPHAPVYVMGESLGGAVAILVATGPNPPPVAGYILLSPATWGRRDMDLSRRAALWIALHTVPDADLSLPEGLAEAYRPTDDIRILRALSEDPKVQKHERVDMIAGVTGVMGDAYAAAPRLGANVLVLFGRHDEILPEGVVGAFLKRLSGPRVALYGEGWHLLTRDLERGEAIEDIGAYALNPNAPLPSGAENNRDWFEVEEP